MLAHLIIVWSGARHIFAVHCACMRLLLIWGVWPKEWPRCEVDCHSSYTVLTSLLSISWVELNRKLNSTGCPPNNHSVCCYSSVQVQFWFIQFLQISVARLSSFVQCLESKFRVHWPLLVIFKSYPSQSMFIWCWLEWRRGRAKASFTSTTTTSRQPWGGFNIIEKRTSFQTTGTTLPL